MNIGDKVEIVEDKFLTGRYYIGLIGKVEKILNDDKLNIGVSFKEEENKEHSCFFPLLKNKILYFNTDELKIVTG